ncbi:MAG: Gfo/Idh/MocA family oxidoreductase [Bryobacteraceae bacterium]
MLSRRDFTAAAAGAAVTAKAWASTAKSAARIPGANDRIHLGVIGCGGMATAGHMRPLVKVMKDINLDFVAVCDLFHKRADQAAELTGAPNKYHEYRKLLENKDIDYVLIATPEHSHAPITIDAAMAGKHIYCEKPMTWNVEQAKQVVATIKRTGVKMQVGVQGMSDDSYITANKFVKDGTLGKVVLAQIDYSRNSKVPDHLYTPPDPDIKPGVNFDWKAWLGAAPKRPFEPDRYFHWRRFWDYSSGIASDLFIHRVTRIIKSVGLTFPTRGVSTGGKFGWPDGIGDVPDTMNILLDYPEGLTVQLVSSMANDTKIDHLLRGHKATLTFTSEGFEITPQRVFRDEMQPISHKKTGAESTVLHHQNLHAAIRSNAALNCDCTLGYYGVVASQVGVESFKKVKYMAWDKAKERIVRA